MRCCLFCTYTLAAVFMSIWYNHTINEKTLWLAFDTAFIKRPKVPEFVVYDCQMRVFLQPGYM